MRGILAREKIISAISHLHKALEELEQDNKRLVIGNLIEAREKTKEAKWITQIEIENEEGEKLK